MLVLLQLCYFDVNLLHYTCVHLLFWICF